METEEPRQQKQKPTPKKASKQKKTTHPRRHTHPYNNGSSARKRDIQLIGIKEGRIGKVGRRNVEFIFNELGGRGCEWEGGGIIVLPGRRQF